MSSTSLLCIALQVACKASNIDLSWEGRESSCFYCSGVTPTLPPAHLRMLLPRPELLQHLGEDSHVLLGDTQVTPHLGRSTASGRRKMFIYNKFFSSWKSSLKEIPFLFLKQSSVWSLMNLGSYIYTPLSLDLAASSSKLVDESSVSYWRHKAQSARVLSPIINSY